RTGALGGHRQWGVAVKEDKLPRAFVRTDSAIGTACDCAGTKLLLDERGINAEALGKNLGIDIDILRRSVRHTVIPCVGSPRLPRRETRRWECCAPGTLRAHRGFGRRGSRRTSFCDG